MKTEIKTRSLITAGFALAFSLALSGCGEEKTEETEAAATENTSLEAVFLESAPDGAVSVLKARESVNPGDTITVSGRVAGAMKPFSDHYATFVLADETLETCERIPGDNCKTPWDACCVEPKTISASRITVQVIGSDGRPVKSSMKGINGLEELDDLVVTGTVAEGSNAENLILNATGIYPKKG